MLEKGRHAVKRDKPRIMDLWAYVGSCDSSKPGGPTTHLETKIGEEVVLHNEESLGTLRSGSQKGH